MVFRERILPEHKLLNLPFASLRIIYNAGLDRRARGTSGSAAE